MREATVTTSPLASTPLAAASAPSVAPLPLGAMHMASWSRRAKRAADTTAAEQHRTA